MNGVAMGKAVDIDLGTTNSVIAAMEGGRPRVIPYAEGNRTTPSVVTLLENGERLSGQMGRRQAILNPKGTISAASRFIGRTYDEVSSRRVFTVGDVRSGSVKRVASAVARARSRSARSTSSWKPRDVGECRRPPRNHEIRRNT
jgi:molecular chaperone DnaK (HSP70)